MKMFLSFLLLASAAVTSIDADNTSIAGKWQIHNNIAGNESDVDCTFAQKGNDLTGNCADAKATGKVDGSKISWAYETEYNGAPLNLKYSGTLDSGSTKIAGTVTVQEYSVDGDFTATLSK